MSMRRYKLRKRILLSLVLIGLGVSSSCVNTEANINSSTTINTEFVDLCDVTKNISDYDDKFVKIHASVRGFHSPLLYSDKCLGLENVILLDLDRETFKKLLESMKKANYNKSEIEGEIFLEGKIKKDQGLIFDYEYEPQIVSNKTIKESKLLTVSKITSINIIRFVPYHDIQRDRAN